MPSAVDLAERELVKLLKSLASKCKLHLELSRDSSDNDVKAFRKVSLKTHPDKGGDVADFQKLSATNNSWQDLCKNTAAPGRPPKAEKPKRQRPEVGKALSVVVPTRSRCENKNPNEVNVAGVVEIMLIWREVEARPGSCTTFAAAPFVDTN